MPKHECLKDLFAEYAEMAAKMTDANVLRRLHDFEGKYKGTEYGTAYLTPQWRMYKRAFRQEAHRRGLSI